MRERCAQSPLSLPRSAVSSPPSLRSSVSAPPPFEPHDTTLLRALVRRRGALGAGRLCLSALLFTGFGAVLISAAGLPGAQTLTLFFGAVALHALTRDLIDDNGAAIWERNEVPGVANRRTALGLVALFVGMFVVFVGLAVWEHFAGSGGTILGAGIQNRRFDRGIGALLQHNLLTLALFVVLGFVYRTYGALLALGWNAANWAGVLTALVLQGLSGATDGPVRYVGLCLLAVLPHLLVEALAYVVGTLAAIFASRAITRYELNDPRLRQVAWAVARLSIIAVGLLVAAAALEQHVPATVLGWLK